MQRRKKSGRVNIFSSPRVAGTRNVKNILGISGSRVVAAGAAHSDQADRESGDVLVDVDALTAARLRVAMRRDRPTCARLPTRLWL
jgi:hypothetical protein